MTDDEFRRTIRSIRERGERPTDVQYREMVDRGVIDEAGDVLLKRPTPPPDPHPEHAKLKEARASLRLIRSYHEFLRRDKGIDLVRWDDMEAYSVRVDALPLEFLGIDEKKLEEEKLAMLEAVVEDRHQC